MNMSGGVRLFVICGTQWLKLCNLFAESAKIMYGSVPYYLEMFYAKYGVSMSIFDVTVTQYLNIPNFRSAKFCLAP